MSASSSISYNNQPIATQDYNVVKNKLTDAIKKINNRFHDEHSEEDCSKLFADHLEPLLNESRIQIKQLEAALKPDDFQKYTLEQKNLESKVEKLRKKILSPQDPLPIDAWHHALSFLPDNAMGPIACVTHSLRRATQRVPDHLLGELCEELNHLVENIKKLIHKNNLKLPEMEMENLSNAAVADANVTAKIELQTLPQAEGKVILQFNEVPMTFQDIESIKEQIAKHLLQFSQLIDFHDFKQFQDGILSMSYLPNLRQSVKIAFDKRLLLELKRLLITPQVNNGVVTNEDQFQENLLTAINIHQIMHTPEGIMHLFTQITYFLITSIDVNTGFRFISKYDVNEEKYLTCTKMLIDLLMLNGRNMIDTVNITIDVILKFTKEDSQLRETILQWCINEMLSSELLDLAVILVLRCTHAETPLRTSVAQQILKHLYEKCKFSDIPSQIKQLTEEDSPLRKSLASEAFEFFRVNNMLRLATHSLLLLTSERPPMHCSIN